MGTREWHVVRVPPVDSFEGMIPLNLYLSPQATSHAFESPQSAWHYIEESVDRLNWVKGALSALELAAAEVDWDGDFRITPHVGALPWAAPLSDEAARYLLVKQDNNGSCFIISAGFPVPLAPYQQNHRSTVVRVEQPST
ncbi:hypothetical protein ABT358_02595 [Streptomyces sp. NPDC000341]|uniref:hypothetical protein n=1 Tax=Streptomyces sp. NPDC000341 TaxID=3156645 RepID=UPI00332AE1E6